MADDWSNVFSWPLIAIHSILTPDGKVLTFGSNQSGQQGAQLYYDVFDPVTNTHNTLTHTTGTDLFCCAAVIIPGTGEILLVGGDARPLGSTNAGVPDVNIYRYQDTSIQASPTGPMDFARWYGTAISLPTGQVFAIGGSDETYKYNGYSEIYTPGLGWRTLTGAYIDEFETSSNYPRTWVAFDGQIITFKPGDPTVYAIDPTGSGSVHAVAELPFTTAWWQPAVMFDVDRVLILANDGYAWIMDISGPTPTFQRTDAVGLDRIWSNMTVLPDGRVLLTGGSTVDASSNNTLTNPSYTAAIWDPDTGDWTLGDNATVPRLYHSTTMLLPDGTVLSLGGGAPGPVTNLNGERYTPDYLFDAAGHPAVRPVITSAPGELHAGDTFTITVSDPDSIDTLALLAFGATTHSFDMSARRMELHFTTLADGTLSVELPDNVNVLTPGYWMLFAIDENGTPSVASTVHIQVDQPFYLPGAAKLDLGVSLETNGRAAYDGYSDTLVLTPNGANKSGSVMSETRVDLRSAFSISFEINVGANDAASDGLAFVLHNSPLGAQALGTANGSTGLGALGIQNGVGIEFDIFYSAGSYAEPTTDHTNIFDTDRTTTNPQITTPFSLGNIEDGQWHDVDVVWNGTTLTYTVDGVTAGVWTGNISQAFLGGSPFAYFGFTGATGSTSAQQQVRILSLDGTAENGTILHADRPANTAPTLSATGSFTINEDTPSAAIAIGARDADGDLLSYSLKTGFTPAKGAVTFFSNGNFKYTPGANANGSDSFTILVSDGHGNTAEKAISVNITPVNDAPTAAATKSITATAGTATQPVAIGATDVDGDALSYALKTGFTPAKGAVAFSNGAFTYTANANASGADSFTILVSDGHGGKAEQVVSVGINPSTVLNLGVVLDPNGSTTHNTSQDIYVLTPNTGNQTGSVMSETRVDLRSAFSISFEINVGANDAGADGMAFVLHNDPTGGHALGTAAGGTGLGAIGIQNGVGIEFDIFYSFWTYPEPSTDHTNIFDTDRTTTNPQITTPFSLGNIEDGQWHDVDVVWNGTTLTYTVDGVAAGTWTGNLSQSFLGGSPFAYFGFTGATGGASAQQQVRILALDAKAENGTILHADRNGTANTPPTVAATGNFTINEDTASTAIAIGASDADGDPLSYSLKTGFTPTKGAVAFSNGNFTYTPTANANGSDSFTILVSDGHGGTAEKAISVNITPVNDAPTAAATASITATAGTATQPVAIGATDVDGDTLSYALKTGFTPTKGAVAFSNGTFTYTANGNASGADSFTILVSDGHGGTAEQVVSVGINPSTVLNIGVVLDPNGSTTHNTSQDIYVLTPNTGNQTGSVMSETRVDLRSAFSISFEINVGANDAGADGMAFVLHNSPAGAQALGTAGGGTGLGALGIQNGVGIEFDIFYSFWTYPEPSTDHTNIFDTDRTTTNPEVTTPFSLGNIEDGQWHDVDVVWNGTTLTYTVDGVTAGTWTGNLSQAFLGGSPFAYFGFTGATGGGSAQQQVRILALDATAENGTILHADRGGAANTPPTVAATGSFTINEDTASTAIAIGASDADGDPLSYSLKTGFTPTKGAVAFSNGTFTYTPTANANGSDSFTILVSDGHGGTAEKAISVNITPVNDAPTAAAATSITATAGAATQPVAIGATDVDGDTLSYALKTGFTPTKGAVAFANGAFTYTANANASGADSFTILVSDGHGGTAEQVVSVGINPSNTPPTVAATGSFTINEDTASTAIAIGASDADGDPLSYSLKTGFTPTKGAVAFSNGNFTYTPTANANGSDSFTILVSDGHGGTAEKVITVAITPVNDAPTVAAATNITATAGTATQPVAIGATDVDGDALSYALKTGFTPTKGAVAFSNGSFTYTANGNASGADSFTILVSDGHGGTAEQVVSVGINPSTVLNLGVALDPNGSTTHNTTQDIYVLTPNTGNQTGSVMSETRVDLRSAFSISFEINVGANDAGADGMAFVLHNSPAGAQALGTAGGGTGLGALGIQNGVGIEFDIFYSFWTYPEPSTDHTNIFDTDRTTTNPEVTTPFSLGNIEDGQWHDVDVVWNGTTLTYTVDGVTAGTWTGNISQSFLGGSPFAYFGFTGATGGASAQQQVRILSLDATAENGTILHADRGGAAIAAQSAFASPDSAALNSATFATAAIDASDQRVAGGAENHTLSGAWGNDTFVFNPGFGNDASAHVRATGGLNDIFHVTTTAFADFAAVQQATTEVGHDIVIAATAFDNLTLKNKTVATHGPNDFHSI